ncbi:NAD-glutamate dehydrogenase domain-containing protein [Haliangium sp.]|uniref:NAD-glutamate dehydrogenase domain-containing protein n=1 Tax=Haliangium sp. TaxID=2663208 RepID=UPI003D1339B5
MSHDHRDPKPQPRILIDELGHRLREAAEAVVPWFLDTMPRRYWQDTDRATCLTHLSAILAARASAVPIRLTLESADKSEWTLIHERDYPGLLAELLEQLPPDRPLLSAKVHTAADGSLVLDVFRFGAADAAPERFDPADQAHAKKLHRVHTAAEHADHAPGPDALPLDAFLSACPEYFVKTVTPHRLVSAWEQCRDLFGTDDTRVALLPETDHDDEAGLDTRRILVATGNAVPNATFARIATHLGQAGLDTRRAYLDRLDDGPGRAVLMASYVVCASEEGPGAVDLEGDLQPDSARWQQLERELWRLRWLDDRALALAHRHPGLGLVRAELIVALGQLAHSSLVHESSHSFARDRIYELCERLLPLSSAIADLFLARFDPAAPMSEDERDQATRELLIRIEREADDPDGRRVLSQLLLVLQATRSTNVHVPHRYALALRFDPAHLGQRQRGDDSPYGAFFVHGRGFAGYHVRFRDIARGGLRVVRTTGTEQHVHESERLYDEAYDLALAQQLKNKDIPEGGAKAVLLTEPGVPVERSVKAFADGLLDLLSPDPTLRSHIANPYGLDERLYLGPDENISPALIEWIVDRAHHRGYPTPEAFMSSKPGAGINHKEYGVTSEGVTVFLEEALLEVGIDPRAQPFTIMFTGGPDGDVAGNEIKILHREFGDNARIVGIADGSGCAEDPAGLDHGELLRLFEAGLPIAHFGPAKLGPEGRLVRVDEEGGVRARNSMHNRLRADAFVPAGGRPETIHSGNWRDFVPGGVPASRVIVEGANLFITPEAREALSTEAGVLIVKDSSANKCGVICSSFEILASMLLTPTEIVAHKPRFVAEVMERLRALARREARLLFREKRHDPGATLPALSVRLSRVILRAKVALERAIDDLADTDQALLDGLLAKHLPPVLIELAGERLRTNVPPRYWSSLAAATLATKVVYREGLDYLDKLGRDALAALVVGYLRQEQETAALVAEIAGSSLPHRDRIAELLELAGTRAGLLSPRRG